MDWMDGWMGGFSGRERDLSGCCDKSVYVSARGVERVEGRVGGGVGVCWVVESVFCTVAAAVMRKEEEGKERFKRSRVF